MHACLDEVSYFLSVSSVCCYYWQNRDVSAGNNFWTLIWRVRGIIPPPPCWFLLKLHKSPDIGKNSDEGISNFRISSQSLIKRNCHNSWTGDDIDMKLGPVTKLTRQKKTSKKFDDGVMSESCDVMSIFQFTVNLEQSGSRIPGA